MSKNPSLEQRYPPGCPDPEWCRGNGCWWKCWCAGDEFCPCTECQRFYNQSKEPQRDHVR